MALTKKLIEGSDLMLFYNGKSLAHASSHTLSLSANTEEINTKDTGVWGMTEVGNITWEITSDYMYTVADYETIFDLMLAKNPIDVVFGLKAGYKGSQSYDPSATRNVDDDGNWVPDSTANMYKGKVIITNLEVSASAGEKATYSITMQGYGAITKGTYQA